MHGTTASLPALLALFACAVCSGQGYDLTGSWVDDAGGRYRIRQAGDTVAWFDDRSPVALNVFMGTISGSSITGRWLDLPGGQMLDQGTLSLRVESNDRLVKTGSSIGYGGTVITRVGGSGPGGGGRCTPVGTWSWLDGHTVVMSEGGAVKNQSNGWTGRWTGLGSGRYQVSWDTGGYVDALTLSADGAAMDGTNNVGRAIHVTCQGAGSTNPGGPGGGGRCTPVGTWDWLDGHTVVVSEGGAVKNQGNGWTGRWANLGSGRYQFSWDVGGYVDTLALSADGAAMDGTNNAGRAIRVTCRGAGTGTAGSTGGGICADPATLPAMDAWLAAANPPENQRPGWRVRYDAWGRLVGETPTNTITGLPEGVDTWMTRCEYLWSISPTLGSTNLGTLREHLEQRGR